MGTDQKLLVLVVEDDPDTAQSLARLLTLYGHEVRVALDGPTALQAAEDSPPDVALLDISLPGIDGYRVARELRDQDRPKRPLIVAVSGHGSEEDRRLSREAGIDLHLVKPVEPGPLQSLLKRFRSFVTPLPELSPSGGLF